MNGRWSHQTLGLECSLAGGSRPTKGVTAVVGSEYQALAAAQQSVEDPSAYSARQGEQNPHICTVGVGLKNTFRCKQGPRRGKQPMRYQFVWPKLVHFAAQRECKLSHSRRALDRVLSEMRLRAWPIKECSQAQPVNAKPITLLAHGCSTASSNDVNLVKTRFEAERLGGHKVTGGIRGLARKRGCGHHNPSFAWWGAWASLRHTGGGSTRKTPQTLDATGR